MRWLFSCSTTQKCLDASVALCMLNLVTTYCCLSVGLSRLAQALPHASQLTYLDVSACSIGDEGVSDLADAISDPFHGIADKAMLNEEFHGAAPTPAHLQVLKLRDNKISDCGVKELGEAIQQSSSLQDLDLAGNQVNDRRAPAKSQPTHTDITSGTVQYCTEPVSLSGLKCRQWLRFCVDPVALHQSALATKQVAVNEHFDPTLLAAVALSSTTGGLGFVQYCLSSILCLAHALQQHNMASSQVMLLVQVGIQGLNCLSAVSVLQKLCLFNCKLGQEASDTIVSCFKDKGFNNLQELDLAGNEIDAPQMQSILEAVQQQGVTPALKVHCYSCRACLHPCLAATPPPWLTRIETSHSAEQLWHEKVLSLSEAVQNRSTVHAGNKCVQFHGK